MESLFANKSITIRNPISTRPWQFVLEPLKGYLMLGEKLINNSKEHIGSWNFGSSQENVFTVEDVVKLIIELWGDGQVKIQETSTFSEINLLQIDCTKSITQLGWKPALDFENSFRYTTNWYKYLKEDTKRDMYQFCVKQIVEYEKISKK